MVQVDITRSCYFDLTFPSSVFDLRNYFLCFSHVSTLLGRLGLGNTTREILHNSFYRAAITNQDGILSATTISDRLRP